MVVVLCVYAMWHSLSGPHGGHMADTSASVSHLLTWMLRQYEVAGGGLAAGQSEVDTWRRLMIEYEVPKGPRYEEGINDSKD
nr:hypothetical protein [Tanacetum cinerariifolium]